LIIAIALAATTARADDGSLDEFIRQCEARGGHVEHDPNGGSTCIEGSSSSDGGGGGQANPAAGQAAVKVLGSIFVTIGFAFMPGHVAELFAKDGEKQTAKQAHDDWNQYAAKRKALIDKGRDAEKESAAYWKVDSEERAQLRDGPAAKPALKPFNPPHLKPDLHYMCDQAKLLMPSTHSTGPLGMFANEGDMVGKCTQFTEPPVDPVYECPTGSLVCGVTNPAQVCCPTGYPIYNPCSVKCYRTTDFVAGPDPGLHCTTSRDCAARQTP